MALYHLGGDARSLVRTTDPGVTATSAGVIRFLGRMYRLPDTVEHWYSRLTQATTEGGMQDLADLPSYIAEFMRCRFHLKRLDAEYPEAMLVRMFRNGMIKKLRMALVEANPPTVHEAVELVETKALQLQIVEGPAPTKPKRAKEHARTNAVQQEGNAGKRQPQTKAGGGRASAPTPASVVADL